MDFAKPSETTYTVYTKSGCGYCTKVKELFMQDRIYYEEINCDEYLKDKETKESFLEFIQTITNIEYRTFPMVFIKGQFIGGFTETKKKLEREEIFSRLDF